MGTTFKIPEFTSISVKADIKLVTGKVEFHLKYKFTAPSMFYL